MCPKDRVERYGPFYPLCMEHSLIAWVKVQEDHERSVKLASRPPVQAVSLSEEGWVYYLRIGDHIKIGYAKDIVRRMVAYPPNTEFLAAVPGTRRDERNLHTRLKEHRAMGREWYVLRADVLAEVEKAQRSPERLPWDPFSRHTPAVEVPSGVKLRRRSGPQGWRV